MRNNDLENIIKFRKLVITLIPMYRQYIEILSDVIHNTVLTLFLLYQNITLQFFGVRVDTYIEIRRVDHVYISWMVLL